jgi:hypothetical protein
VLGHPGSMSGAGGEGGGGRLHGDETSAFVEN